MIRLALCVLLAGCANVTSINTPDDSVHIRCDRSSTKMCNVRVGRLTSCRCVDNGSLQNQIDRMMQQRRF